MEITSFYPMIATSDFEGTKAAYEALGFKVAHTIIDPEDPKKEKHKHIVMKNDKGLCLALILNDPEYNPGISTMFTWMNVRDFDGAVALLKEHGFTAYTTVRETEFVKTISMKAPDGHLIIVAYHKREHDAV